MTLGERIRSLRRARGLTQAQVAHGAVSKNMLCLLEHGQVMPSIDTLQHIARVLDVPVGYFFDDDDDLFFYKKKQSMPKIKSLFKGRKYEACIRELEQLGDVDDECAYLLTVCYTELGISHVKSGNLLRAQQALEKGKEYAEKTMYDTSYARMRIALYLPVANNIQAPLLEFDAEQYRRLEEELLPTDFFKYLTQDTENAYSDSRYADHMIARSLMRERRYSDAALRLHRIEDTRSTLPYDAYLFYGVYTDLEACYKELCDFERAYRYATKRMSLLESFHS